MQKHREEFEALLALIKLEKEEDLRQYKEIVQKLPLQERKKKGYSWYPVQVNKSGYTYGERAFVVIEKDSEKDTSNLFRPGKTVNFFTQQPEANRPELVGVIQFVDKNKMKIVLNSKDLPDWLGLGSIGVDLLFDDRTYLEMEKAVKKVMNAKGDRLAELRNILLGNLAPKHSPITPVNMPHLNTSQNQAIQDVLSSNDIVAIHGPPGTGKTTTLAYAIKLMVQHEKSILVCAPSNTAADLLTERISAQGVSVLRIGNISRVDETIIQHTLDAQISGHPDSKNIKKVKIQAADFRRQARKYKRRFGHEERKERQHLHKQATELAAWANQLEDRLIEQLLHGAQVITCTLVGATNRVLNKLKFRTVIIDEAAQALEPATWIPITKASRIVLAGDPFQLPPTVKSNAAMRKGLGKTLLEKCLTRLPKVNLLNIQYRMHETIMGFSNDQFYGGKLIAADSIKDQKLDFRNEHSMVFIDTAGTGFEEKVRTEFQSRYNPEEFMILCEHLYQLKERILPEEEENNIPPAPLGENATAESFTLEIGTTDNSPFSSDSNREGGIIPFPKIAIISPYRQQVIHIKKALSEDEKLKDLPITVNTIDGFQGQEREIVYISLVRSNGKREIGFLKDYRRMNVAMTRAKKLLVVVGDSATIGKDKFYADFLEYVEVMGSYETAWEYMR